MKKILLVGAVDKRAISYPLIKVLMFLGKTLIVTDDAMYRRFDGEYGTRFSFENSDFLITPVVDEGVEQYVDSVKADYENILYITTSELIPADKVIYFRGVDRAILGDTKLKQLENIDHTEVYVTFSKLNDSNALKIEPSKANLAYFSECEDKKEFLATKDGAFSTVLMKFFEKELDVPKSSLKTLLARKG